MSALPLVVIGFYGTTLDAPSGDKRWGRWRPTLSAVQHEDLAPSGRIRAGEVDDEIARLEASWQGASAPTVTADRLREVLGSEAAAQIDLFDRAQLEVVLAVCAASSSLSEAGRTLFANSRAKRASTNDADRLRKYLARFGLDFQRARGGDQTSTE